MDESKTDIKDTDKDKRNKYSVKEILTTLLPFVVAYFSANLAFNKSQEQFYEQSKSNSQHSCYAKLYGIQEQYRKYVYGYCSNEIDVEYWQGVYNESADKPRTTYDKILLHQNAQLSDISSLNTCTRDFAETFAQIEISFDGDTSLLKLLTKVSTVTLFTSKSLRTFKTIKKINTWHNSEFARLDKYVVDSIGIPYAMLLDSMKARLKPFEPKKWYDVF